MYVDETQTITIHLNCTEVGPLPYALLDPYIMPHMGSDSSNVDTFSLVHSHGQLFKKFAWSSRSETIESISSVIRDVREGSTRTDLQHRSAGKLWIATKSKGRNPDITAQLT